MLVGQNPSLKRFNTYSVQLEVSQHRLGVARSHTSVLHLGVRGVFGHRSELQLGFKSNSRRKLGVPGNVFQSISGDFVLGELKALELVLDHTGVQVAVLWKLELHREPKWHVEVP